MNVFICVLCVCLYTMAYMWWLEDNLWESCVSSTMWAPVIKFMISGLVISSFSSWTLPRVKKWKFNNVAKNTNFYYTEIISSGESIISSI